MIRFRYSLVQLLFTFAVLLTVATGTAMWAQDEFDEDWVEVDEVVAVQAQNVFIARAENFDQWVFQNTRNAKKARERLDSMLTLKVESVDRVCHLTEFQKDKLLLAGRGDIGRFFDSVEEVRTKFLAARQDQQEFNKIWQHISPLQMRFQAGIFNDTSLVHTILKRTLDPEQAANYEQAEKERMKFRYAAKAELIVTMLESGLALTDQQHQQFVKLLLNETELPKKYGQYCYYVMMFQAAKLPEDKLKPLFDDAQWRALKKPLAQGKGMERHLKKNGFIP